MEITPGITIGGKYVVERPLARGGMGAVWVARHVKLGSPVAIKFLDAHLAAAPALVTRFEREARAAANLDTPHVVHVHDYGVEDGTPYLVMELLRGEDLNTRLRHRHRLSLPEAAKIVSQMGRALRRAHEAGIVHRDLKPANVFIARSEDDEVVKVLDFGIAKETWSRVEDSTKTGEVFGSPHYMSPEQARAQKTVDHRADVWATGAMVYRMVTGRLPFPGEVLGEVLSSVLVDPFPPMAEAAPDLPPALDAFFTRALAKKMDKRYSTIGELVDAFAAIAGAEPSRASHSQMPAAPPTSPALDPAAPPQTAPIGPAASPGMVDTVAATQVLVNVHAPVAAIAAPMAPAVAPANPLPVMEVQSPVGRTGPSIANATSSVLPPPVAPRKSSAMWIAGGAVICAVAVGLVILSVIREEPDVPAKGSLAVAASAAVTVPPEPPPAEGPMKSAAPLSVEPTKSARPTPPTTVEAPASPASATASTSAPAIPAEPPTAKPEPAATSKPATPAVTSKPVATIAAPVAKPATKKQNPDWGL